MLLKTRMCSELLLRSVGVQHKESELQNSCKENFTMPRADKFGVSCKGNCTIPRASLSKSKLEDQDDLPHHFCEKPEQQQHVSRMEPGTSQLRTSKCETIIPMSEPIPQPNSLERGSRSSLITYSCQALINVEMSTERRETGRSIVRTTLIFIIACLYLAYFAAVLVIPSKTEEAKYWCEKDGFLIIMSASSFVGLFYFKIAKPKFGRLMRRKWLNERMVQKLAKLLKKRYFSATVDAAVIGAFIIFLALDTADDRSRLVSAFGILVLLLIGFIFSAAPRKVVWRHIMWGIGLQFIFGIMILRWPVGQSVFKCIGDKIQNLLKLSSKGSSVIFGELVEMKILAFKFLSGIIFVNFCVQILYYYGVMQWIVMKLGWLLQITVGTTACESVNAAANIFLGMTDAPLLIRPYLRDMTMSELHAVMTGGFATVAGGILAAYISFGIDAAHLLTASVMSAPAALALSKLFYPEVEISKTTASDIKITERTEVNVLHAALEGVATAIPLVVNIAANLVAFIAFIAFCDSVLNWSCRLCGVEGGVCSLSNIVGYALMPLAWVMGVPWKDCYYVGQLIGTKTVINEFVAYLMLSTYIKDGVISKRSEIIATYALCGFSNIGSMGVQIGAFGSLVPERKRDFSKLAFRAMIAGSVACFLTACVAGSLVTEADITTAANRTLQE